MVKPNLSRKLLKKGAVFTLSILVFSIAALPFGVNQETPDTRTDYAAAREDLGRFESAVNDVISSTFKSDMAIVQWAKGYYMPGTGISVSFQINIHTDSVINTPFGQVRRKSGVTPEMKMRRIEEFREKLIRVLQDNGDGFRQLRKEDCVTIAAFFEDRNFPGEPNANKIIVMSAYKKDLDELGHKSDRIKEFKQRMKIIEY